jgi:hypothetical protein
MRAIFFVIGRRRAQMPRNHYVEAEIAALPWTLVQYKPMDRRGVTSGPPLDPCFGLHCDDTASTRSPGRSYYPQGQPSFSFPNVHPSSQFWIPFLLEKHIRHHTPSSDRKNTPRCLSEPLVAATVSYCGQESDGEVSLYRPSCRRRQQKP